MPIESAAIGLELVLDIVARPAVNGIARLHTWLAGIEILILGPARAGKTSFSEYLQFGVLETELPTAKTVDPHKSASFRVGVGKGGTLEVKVKRAVDMPGQLGPMEHAKIAAKRKPRALVVILDSSAPIQGNSAAATGAWVVTFCKHLNEELRKSAKFRQSLKTIVFVCNKADKVEPAVLETKLKKFRAMLKKHLPEFYGPEIDDVPVLPCILIDGPQKTTLADAVVVRIAKSLA